MAAVRGGAAVYFCLMITVISAHGISQFGFRNYTEYYPGSADSILILTAPHGGLISPDDMPIRVRGCWNGSSCTYLHNCTGVHGEVVEGKCKATTVTDLNTREIGLVMREEIAALTGGIYPHLVLCHLQRPYLDANRDIMAATFGDEDAITVYNDFHGFINKARESLSPGLLIDLHGQGHPEAWVELGYLLRTAQLNYNNYTASQTSVWSLSNHTLQNLSSIQDLIYGPASFGGLLESKGYKTVPSPTHPSPGEGRYYSGGYITQTYGSMHGGNVDSIQIESPGVLRYDDEVRTKYAKDLASSAVEFMNIHYIAKAQASRTGIEWFIIAACGIICSLIT